METVGMTNISDADLNQLPHLNENSYKPEAHSYIKSKKSFYISYSNSKEKDIIHYLEKLIDESGFRVRVLTNNRAIMTGYGSLITPVVSIASAIGIGLHNAVTFNPDFEIVKCVVEKYIVVLYKK